MSNPTVRVGLAGSGFAARFQYAALQKVHGPTVVVAGVWSPNEANRRKFASERGIAAYDSLDALADDVDVVSACVPGSQHEAIGCAALARGRHVIIEKPFTGYYGDGNGPKEPMRREALASAERLIETERATSRVLFSTPKTGSTRRPSPKERKSSRSPADRCCASSVKESHSGSHSPFHGMWKHSGGGSPAPARDAIR